HHDDEKDIEIHRRVFVAADRYLRSGWPSNEVYSGRRNPRHPHFEGWGRPRYSWPVPGAPRCSAPFGAISATMSIRGPTVVSARPASPASWRAVSGAKARVKPSFKASLSRAAACATGRTVPDSEISPK